MATNTLASNFANDVSLYIAKKLLMLALKQLAVYQLCMKDQFPKNEGRQWQYTRYDRVDLPSSTLDEGITPGDTQMQISIVQAVMDQWGAVIPISDVAIDSVKHPVLQQAISLASLQASETIDREIVKVMLTGTNVYFPGVVTTRAGLVVGSLLGSVVIGKAVSNLRSDGAHPYEGNLFVGVVDPFSEDDINSADATFVDAMKYGDVRKLMVGEIGTWKGVRWIRSNTIPSIGLLAGASGASSATAGSLVASTTYNAKVAVVDKATKHETYLTATFNAATDPGETSVDITLPALPAGATPGSLMRIYFGTNGGTLYLAQDDLAPSAVINQGVVPTSGPVAQAAPPATYRVHHAFIMGKQAVACVELNKVKAYLTPAVPSDSDPLVQRRKVGWKCDFKAAITNEDYIARIEHVTTNGN